MANAWIIPPLPIVSAASYGDLAGVPMHVANDYAGVTWTGAINAAGGSRMELFLDLGADRDVDTVLLFGITDPQAFIEVRAYTAAQYAATGFSQFQSWGFNRLSAGTEGLSDGTRVGLQTAPGPAQAARYLMLLIYPFGGPFPIARVVAGARIQLDRNFSYGATQGVRDLGSLDFSARGVLSRRRAKKLRTLSLTFANVQRAEVEGVTGPLLERIGNTEMIAVVTDPAPHPMRERRCFFGPLVGDLGQTWRNSAAWEARINLVSIF